MSTTGPPGSPLETSRPVDSTGYDPNRLFALIIGINKYAAVDAGNAKFRALQGAVADADAVNNFLTDLLSVPEQNIVMLKDEQATADAIKTGILAFASNPRIQKGDPILIYYAGHGADADMPENWTIYGEKATRKVQLLLPYDFSPETTNSPKGQGIVDRTLSALLHNVAAAKGNNILVVLDSCHSASGTRSPGDLQRGHDLPPEYRIYDKLDVSDVTFIEDHSDFRNTDVARGAEVPEHLANANMRSHVLLAACEEKQSAGERNGRGHFTTTLLDFLGSVDIHKTTYMNTILNLPDLPNPKQKPRCEGVNQNRFFFRSTLPSRTTVFPLILEKNGLLSIEAGESAGITAATEMTIHTKPAAVDVLDTAKVVDLSPSFAKLQLTSGEKVPAAKKEQYRFARRGHRDHSVKIYVDKSTAAMLELSMDCGKSALEPLFDALFVDKIENCDIALDREASSVGFLFFDEILNKYKLGSTRRTSKELDDPGELHRLLEAACYFYAHLRSRGGPYSIKISGAVVRSPEQLQAQLALKFEVECHQVTAEFGNDLAMVYKPANETNVYSEEKEEISVIARKADDKEPPVLYGFKITNKTSYKIFMWVFFFNCRGLSIDRWYQPASGNSSCLEPQTGFIEIGRGACIDGAYAFTLNKDEDRDVGFLKIFFSTKYVDLTSIPQTSPFDDAGGKRDSVTVPPTVEFWGTKVIPVIQTTAAGT